MPRPEPAAVEQVAEDTGLLHGRKVRGGRDDGVVNWCGVAVCSLFIVVLIIPVLTSVVSSESETQVDTTTVEETVVTTEDTETVVAAGSTGASSDLPHIVVVMIDDMGWNSMGYQTNAPLEFTTPHMDRLAWAGIRLGRHYAHYLCAPSRGSFNTGRLPVHNFVNGTNSPFYVNPKDPVSGCVGDPLNSTTIVGKMREAGYIPHHFGKWDVGMATSEHTPVGRGYESSMHYWGHEIDHWDFTGEMSSDMINEDGVCANYTIRDCWIMDQTHSGHCDVDMIYPTIAIPGVLGGQGIKEEYADFRFLTAAKAVIEAHDPDTPLFLVHNMQVPHQPYQVPLEYYAAKAFLGDDIERRAYASMVLVADDVVGEIETALKDAGLWKNTLLLVTSDNGGSTRFFPTCEGNNYPLKGHKGTSFEGGIRVASFLSGGYLEEMIAPERLGSELTEMIHFADWYVTFCNLIGVDWHDYEGVAAGLPEVDGLDVWPYITGEDESSPRTEVHVDAETLIVGDYKIITGNEHKLVDASCEFEELIYLNCEKGCLYNLVLDKEESHDLAKILPDVLAEMQDLLSTANELMFTPDWGEEDEVACEQAIENAMFWGPWL